ncbi:Zn(2)-C6 fungal-type domain-containing protein [Mycena sanguinolenta]|uniref:Zn(2)-C6 fungal-type domain-containing protein n=1 Tax=Mycena sanguinolenta TaxID=230812 RepID=A0A8H7D4R3_9AGAR|nr:Zn(2)-C6 fungal-type domain-containing protein [Mycena sanguinolenta]
MSIDSKILRRWCGSCALTSASVRSELADVRAQLTTAHSAILPNSQSPPSSISSTLTDTAAEASTSSQNSDIPAAALSIIRAALRSLTAAPIAPHLDDVFDVNIASKFQKLQVGMAENPFLGRSSGAFLVNAALDLKPDVYPKGSELSVIEGDSRASVAETWTSRRLRFWTGRPRDDTRSNNTYRFPEGVPMKNLIELFFARQNIFLPLLHRPTFERYVDDGLHLRDRGFAATVLLVCAIGARWSVEPTVADAGLDCGWEWFDQVQLDGKHPPLLGHPTLYDVQRYCLAAQFLKASAMPHTYWTLIGVGLRLAQDLGMHRSKGLIGAPSIEVYKYWSVLYLRLEHHDMQSQYSLKKVRTAFSIDDVWELQAIAELDSALNNWRDQLPNHLRWDPQREDPVFFDQSVAIHTAYFNLQITIHRPFIPMLRRAPTAVPSLILCTSAARGCANVVDVQRRRRGSIPFPLHLNAAFMSGLVLLLNILSTKRREPLLDSSRELAHVHKCMEVIRLCEGRWKTAGMLWDVLSEVASVGQLPLLNTLPKIPPNYHGVMNNGDEHDAGSRSDNASSSADNLWSSDLDIHPTFSVSYPLSDTPEMAHSDSPAPTSFAPLPIAVHPENMPLDIYTDPTQASRELADMITLMDTDPNTMAVWTTVPTGLGVEDWGAYFSSFSHMAERDPEGRRYDE